MKIGDFLQHNNTMALYKITEICYMTNTQIIESVSVIDENNIKYILRNLLFYKIIEAEQIDRLQNPTKHRHPYHGKWFFSDNEDMFYDPPYDTAEEAFEAAKIEYEDDSSIGGAFLAMAKTYEPKIYVEDLLDNLVEQAIENSYCEISEGFLEDCSCEDKQELEDKLNEVLTKWMYDKGYEPKFTQLVKQHFKEFEPEKDDNNE